MREWIGVPSVVGAAGKQGFDGRTVVAFESRRAAGMAKLIEGRGGKAIVGPMMREVPLAETPEITAFGVALFADQIDVLVCLTGVGVRALIEVLELRRPREELRARLSKLEIIARGPKPVRVLKELGIPIAFKVPEPNTWRELLASLDDGSCPVAVKDRAVAVQEYGISNPSLLGGLRERGASVRRIPIYRWALPQDLEPAKCAIRAIADADASVVLFTSAQQVVHVLELAAEMGLEDQLRRGMSKAAIASIGPTCTESLKSNRIRSDFEPSHPRMGLLVEESARECADLVAKLGRV